MPNASLKTVASAWAYYPYGDAEADIAVPYERYGTRIIHPEWWREGIPSEKAATAVVASREMEDREPGDDGYWRPRFDAIAERAGKKLTPEARRGLRSHEWEGSLQRACLSRPPVARDAAAQARCGRSLGGA